jgi:hypothetical protein
MSIDAMKQALEALETLARYENPETKIQVRKPRDGGPIVTMYPHKVATEAADALRLAIEQAERQEPVAWTPITEPYPPGDELDILMGDGSVLCGVLPQADGDLWWSGSGIGEKFIDPQYANVTHWRAHSDTAPPQRQPLTDGEVADIWYGWPMHITREEDAIAFARAIERAHGIGGGE